MARMRLDLVISAQLEMRAPRVYRQESCKLIWTEVNKHMAIDTNGESKTTRQSVVTGNWNEPAELVLA